jgi:hypothetical protein
MVRSKVLSSSMTRGECVSGLKYDSDVATMKTEWTYLFSINRTMKSLFQGHCGRTYIGRACKGGGMCTAFRTPLRLKQRQIPSNIT